MAKLIAQKLEYKLTLVENDLEAYKLYKRLSSFRTYVLEDFFKYKPKDKFDLVFSFGVIEHFPRRKTRIEAIAVHKRLSKKYVAIFVSKDSFFVRHYFHYPEDKGFEKLYKREELESELKDAGLKVPNFAQNLHAIGFLCRVN